MKNILIYQLALRTFTPEGDFQSAKKLIKHIASLGVNYIYLCPFYVADEDYDTITWSLRQIDSNTNNPKNPYKMYDYYNVDPEYGTKDDLIDFVQEAHKEHLKVIFDLVYLHCGRNAVFIKENPDYVIRNEDGTIKIAELWPFARLNYNNPNLRKYLIENMKYYAKEISVDGFRCDVGDSVPLDFWREAFNEVKKYNKDILAINEGVKAEYIKDVFDINYSFKWRDLICDIFSGKTSARELITFYSAEKELYGDNINKIIRTLDTHDTASDCGENRNENVLTTAGVEAALVITNTYDGIPFLWNGYEVCDNSLNNMFSNRYYGKKNNINWSRGFSEEGKKRLRFIRKIHRLRKQIDALHSGTMRWINNTNQQHIITYEKKYGNQVVVVIVNSSINQQKCDLYYDLSNIDVIISKESYIFKNEIRLDSYGYMIINCNNN